jgi:phenylpropionate dioxygenase-like ring-hydroxylating dioxygenase large terminal subunit
VAESRRVRRRPVAIKVLGEEIVLWRAHGKIAALTNRCPHRGAQLSLGRSVFPGTLSCGYHGWTFNSQGECVACVVDGPQSRVPGRVRIKAYPAEERLGMVWLFIGEGEPPPLAEDLPSELLRPDALAQVLCEEWRCNWRFVNDNQPDMLHAMWVHRSSINWLFNQLSAWGRVSAAPLPDGAGVHVVSTGAAVEAEYPGLGKFPARQWWRVQGRQRPGQAKFIPYGCDVRLPGYITLSQKEGYLGILFFNVGWPVPIDEHRTLFVNFNVTYPKTRAQRLALTAWYRLYFRPLQKQFLHQDRRLEESQSQLAPEMLCATDAALSQWRRLATLRARQPRLPNGAVEADAQSSASHSRSSMR